jgi:hypothetical protein
MGSLCQFQSSFDILDPTWASRELIGLEYIPLIFLLYLFICCLVFGQHKSQMIHFQHRYAQDCHQHYRAYNQEQNDFSIVYNSTISFGFSDQNKAKRKHLESIYKHAAQKVEK